MSEITSTTLKKVSHRKLVILSAVKNLSISEVIDYLVERDPESKKILEVTRQ